MKVVEKMERFQKAYSILEALTSEFQMFKNEETKEDWTTFMRNLYKYEYTIGYCNFNKYWHVNKYPNFYFYKYRFLYFSNYQK